MGLYHKDPGGNLKRLTFWKTVGLSSETQHPYPIWPRISTYRYVLCAVLSCSVMSSSLWPHGLTPGSSVHGDSPDKNTGVGGHAFLQGIFPTQGSNLPHRRQILHHLSHQGSPRILEWVAYPFSRGSSRPRNRTRVSCIADGFFTC